MKLTHVRLLVDDYTECFRFYRNVLELEPTFGDEESGYGSFATGDASLALFERTEQGEVVDLLPPGDGSLLVLEVEDVDAVATRLGDRLLSGPTDRKDWGIRVAYLRDPAGNLIELNQSL